MPFSSDSFRTMIAGSPFHLALAALAVIALALYVYRRTTPVVRPAVRIVLTTLRTLALLLIILALFEWTIQSRQVETTPPLLAVAVDQSASMQQKEGGISRSERTNHLLREELPARLDREMAIRYFGFAAHPDELTPAALDSLAYGGDATDITGALEEIKSRLLEQNLAGILLLSDGNYTQGGDPGRYAAEIGVPIHAIGLGSAEVPADIGITHVEANPFAFAGESTPIRVTVRSTSGQREKVSLSLEGAGGEASTTRIDLQRGPLDSAVVLNYTPAAPGRRKLQVVLEPSGKDANRANNRFTLYQDVLRSKTLIFVLAGTLSPDLSLLRNHLAADERFDLKLLTELGDNSGLQLDHTRALQDSIGESDLLVLYNFPRRTSSPRTLSLLQAALEKRPRPLLFISGRDTDWNRLKPLEPFLPIRASVVSMGEMEVTPVLTAAGQQHPVMQIPVAGTAAWNLLPPVYTRERLLGWWPDAEILAHARPAGPAAPGGDAEIWPLILVRNAGAKSAAVMGYELWRWHLMMSGIGNTDETYHHFFQNLVRWLQIEQSSDLIRVRTDQSTYHFGDEVHFIAQIVDARFQPVDDAEVELMITTSENGGAENTLYLTLTGKGSYSGAFRPEKAGDYRVEARVRRGQTLLGEATHLFSVGSYNEELSDVALKENLLRRLAQLSGGSYAPPDSAAALIAAIRGKKLHRTLTKDVELWNRGALLAAILTLLALEWFLRRRKGML